MQTELIQRIDREIEAARDLVAQDTIKLIQIESVKGEPAADAPFGPGPKAVLDAVMEMGRQNGFYIKDYGCGVVSLSLQPGEPDLGIWLHGDIVPAGEGWIWPPFVGTPYKGCIIGRGATDNKGQLASIFRVLKIFQTMEIPLHFNPALYVGSNEETGMEDVKAFLQQHTPPRLSLVPDGGFPVGYGGKGGMTVTLRSKQPLRDLTVTAGMPDAPGKAAAKLLDKSFEANSLPRHGSNPDPNGNMITKIMEQLLEETSVAAEDRPVLQFVKDVSLDIHGKKLGIYVESAAMTPLTVFSQKIETLDGNLCLTVNIRYPVETTADAIVKQLGMAAEQSDMEVAAVKTGVMPYILQKDTPVIRALNAIANEVNGTEAEPFTMSGGTYAHWLPNALVYGMSGSLPPEDFPAGHGGAHGIDEVVSLDRLQKAMRIYARAFLALNDMDW